MSQEPRLPQDDEDEMMFEETSPDDDDLVKLNLYFYLLSFTKHYLFIEIKY